MLGTRCLSELAMCEFTSLTSLTAPTPDPDPDPDDAPSQEVPVEQLALVTQRYGSHSFMTRDTDTLSRYFIGRRLSRGVVAGRRISIGQNGLFGGLITASFGEIQFANTDGGLDFLIEDYAIDGRRLNIKLGRTEIDAVGREVVASYDSFTHAYTAIAGAWIVEHDVARLRLRDPGVTLQRRLQTAVYGGTGGRQGTSDMKGRTVPTCIGICQNVRPQQVDPDLLTYQVHDGSVVNVSRVYDAGVVVPGEIGSPSTAVNYTTYAALAAATVAAGTHATCVQEGYFRLGSTPVGIVTADVNGDNVGLESATRHGLLLLRILEKYSPLTDDEIDDTSFFDFRTLQPAFCGLFLPAGDESTIEEVIERVALSAGAVCGPGLDSVYRVLRLDAPTSTPSHQFDDRSIMAIERIAPPYGVPPKSWTVAGNRNWTLMTGAEVAASVTQSRRRFLEVETRKVTVQTPGIAAAHPTSSPAARESLFNDIAVVSAEAIRLATLYSLRRTIYRLTVKRVLFDIAIGETIRITYPRWNLTQGRNFVVTSVSDDTDVAETELEVFG